MYSGSGEKNMTLKWMIGRFLRYMGGFAVVFGSIMLMFIPQNLSQTYTQSLVIAAVLFVIGIGCLSKEKAERNNSLIHTNAILDKNQRNELTRDIQDFEIKLRQFIIAHLSEGWEERIRNEAPSAIYKSWENRREQDVRKGRTPDPEIISYADFGDYGQLVVRFPGLLAKNEDVDAIKVKLRDLADYGRNPAMHSRKPKTRDYHVTKATLEYLTSWISRQSKS